MRKAFENKEKLFFWSLINATIGIILKLTEDEFEYVGKFVRGIFQMAWGLTTFFVVPVLIFENKPVFESIKKSGKLFKKTWGENVTGQATIGIIGFFAVIIGSIPLILSLFLILYTSPLIYRFFIAISVIFLFLNTFTVVILTITLDGIFTAALYNYAVTGKVPKQYSADFVRNAFKKT